MTIRMVRLGTPRNRSEGLRIGAVRHPPRGVPKSQHAVRNWYDVWFPELAPSTGTVKLARAAVTRSQWAAFVKRYRGEMAVPEKVRMLKLLAALSHESNFSLGCYCAEEFRCHRSVLRALLEELGAELA